MKAIRHIFSYKKGLDITNPKPHLTIVVAVMGKNPWVKLLNLRNHSWPDNGALPTNFPPSRL